MTESVIRIGPFHYIHVLNTNTNITEVIEGPKTFVRKAHEVVVKGPDKMIQLPPLHFCNIKNPVVRDKAGNLEMDPFDMPLVRFGDEEIRT